MYLVNLYVYAPVYVIVIQVCNMTRVLHVILSVMHKTYCAIM